MWMVGARFGMWIEEAGLMLLATLNRLSGRDDPKLRAELIDAIGPGC